MEQYRYVTDDDEPRLASYPTLAALAAASTFEKRSQPAIPEEVASPSPVPVAGSPLTDIVRPTATSARSKPAEDVMKDAYRPDFDPEEVQARVKHHTELAIVGLAAYIEKATADPTSHTIREAQLPVFVDLLDALSEHKTDLKGYFSLPTGSGKSFIYTEFIKPTPLKTVIATPTNLLVDGIVVAFNKFTSTDENHLSVGTVSGKGWDATKQVTATTYASLTAHTLQPRQHGIQPHLTDLLVLDEAHHALGAQTRKAVEHHTHALQLGFTATENYSEKRQLSSLLPTEIHKLTISEACSFGLISAYSNWVVKTGLDISSVRINNRNEYEADELERRINNPERNHLVVSIYQQHLPNRKAFVFCSGIQHAKDIAAVFRSQGVNARAVFGKGMRDTERDAIMQSAKGFGPNSVTVLCSDQLLVEGVDIDTFGVALNAVPVLGSYVRAKQRGGRALRRNDLQPDKRAIIVDIIDSDYRTAPLLFCDEEIGQTAHVGERSVTPDQTIEYGNGRRGVLITDPDSIEQMADQFEARRAAQKKKAYPDPPEGWLRSHEIAGRLGLDQDAFTKSLQKLRDDESHILAENRGMYRTSDNRPAYFYNQDFITFYESRRANLLIERKIEQPPEGWLSAKQVEALYGIGISAPAELQLASKKYPGQAGRFALEYAPQTEAIHYSPDVVRAMATARRKAWIAPHDVPPGWRAAIDEQHPDAVRDYRHLLSAIALQERVITHIHVRVIDDTPYVSPNLWRLLTTAMQPPEGWKPLAVAAKELDIDPLDLRGMLYEEFGEGQSRLLRLNWRPDLASKGTDGYLSPSLIDVISYELQRRKG